MLVRRGWSRALPDGGSVFTAVQLAVAPNFAKSAFRSVEVRPSIIRLLPAEERRAARHSGAQTISDEGRELFAFFPLAGSTCWVEVVGPNERAEHGCGEVS